MVVRRQLIEAKLLGFMKEELLSPEAYDFYVQQLISESQNQQGNVRDIEKALKQCQSEINNLMAAIKAGIITETTKTELEALEHQKTMLGEELKAAQQKPDLIMPKAREAYLRLVNDLNQVENVYAARNVVQELLGTVELKMNKSKGYLEARVQDSTLPIALAELLVARGRFELPTLAL